jgi:hypothetical protein
VAMGIIDNQPEKRVAKRREKNYLTKSILGGRETVSLGNPKLWLSDKPGCGKSGQRQRNTNIGCAFPFCLQCKLSEARHFH